VRLNDAGVEIRTGSYTTDAVNNEYGYLTSQLTDGASYNMIWSTADPKVIDIDGDGIADGNYIEYRVGTYNTVATLIDGFGTVRETQTLGESVRLNDAGVEIRTGSYTTDAVNNEYGYLTSQLTDGASYNMIWSTDVPEPDVDIDNDGIMDGSYVEKIVGAYTTLATKIDGFGNVRETLSEGVSFAKGDITRLSGIYTTSAVNNEYGYLISQITTGENYQKGNVLLIAGIYTTVATSIDGFGTARETTTNGISYPRGDTTKISASYTTIAGNNAYGYLISQITEGETYHRGNTSRVASAYTTEATDIDGFGTVRENVTCGES
jgi:hypothetical protein